MFLAFGLMAALWEAQRSGKGQVIDAAMCEGVSYMMGLFQSLTQQGLWVDERASNMLDGGAPYYTCYETSDGRYVAVAAIEARFYGELLAKLGLDGIALPGQHDRAGWPELHSRIAAVFKTRSRDEWATHFANSDACVTPVLAIGEVQSHGHAVSRESYIERDGVVQPAPHPRFSRTQGVAGRSAAIKSTSAAEVLQRWHRGGNQ
jgi:alpha-methylacyl-CoA racemase